MPRALNLVPRAAIFLAGVAAGVLSNSRRQQAATPDPAAAQEFKRALSGLEARIAAVHNRPRPGDDDNAWIVAGAGDQSDERIVDDQHA